MEECECSQSRMDPARRWHAQFLVCANCSGCIVCDFCRLEGRYVPIISLAMFVMRGSYTCCYHAWRGLATAANPLADNIG
jgi:hypothetical protein